MLVRRHVSRKEKDVVPRGLQTILLLFFLLLSFDIVRFPSLSFRFVSFRNGEAEMGNEGKRANGWNELVEEGVKGVVSMM